MTRNILFAFTAISALTASTAVMAQCGKADVHNDNLGNPCASPGTQLNVAVPILGVGPFTIPANTKGLISASDGSAVWPSDGGEEWGPGDPPPNKDLTVTCPLATVAYVVEGH